jgi:hypothetical protein
VPSTKQCEIGSSVPQELGYGLPDGGGIPRENRVHIESRAVVLPMAYSALRSLRSRSRSLSRVRSVRNCGGDPAPRLTVVVDPVAIALTPGYTQGGVVLACLPVSIPRRMRKEEGNIIQQGLSQATEGRACRKALEPVDGGPSHRVGSRTAIAASGAIASMRCWRRISRVYTQAKGGSLKLTGAYTTGRSLNRDGGQWEGGAYREGCPARVIEALRNREVARAGTPCAVELRETLKPPVRTSR